MPFTPRERVSTAGRIRVRINEVALARGVTNAAGLANVQAIQAGTELPEMTIWQLVRHPDARSAIGFDTIARLCMFLRCQPGDLLVYDAEGEDRAGLPSVDDYIPFESWDGPRGGWHEPAGQREDGMPAGGRRG